MLRAGLFAFAQKYVKPTSINASQDVLHPANLQSLDTQIHFPIYGRPVHKNSLSAY